MWFAGAHPNIYDVGPSETKEDAIREALDLDCLDWSEPDRVQIHLFQLPNNHMTVEYPLP